MKGTAAKPAGKVKIAGGAGNVKVASTAKVTAKNANGTGGEIKINEKTPGEWDQFGDVEIAGTLDASGGSSGKILVFGDSVKVTDTAVLRAGDATAGGFIETSGNQVEVAGVVNAGFGGTWSIDPENVNIDGAFATTISNALSAHTHVNVEADNDITVGANIVSAGNGNLVLRSDFDTDGVGTVIFNNGITIDLSAGSGNLSIFYNPISYATPTDYSVSVDMGSGVLRAYMLVNTLENLQAMNTNLGGTYALGRDIDATATSGWNAGAGFAPIGDNSSASAATRFTGTFDGQGYEIANLYINRPLTKNVGLFGYTEGATLRNVGLTGGTVQGYNVVGGLVGQISSSSISNSYSTGSVEGGGPAVGGLVGQQTANVTNSYWDEVTSNMLQGVGLGSHSGITRLSTEQFQNTTGFMAFSGWNFETI